VTRQELYAWQVRKDINAVKASYPFVVKRTARNAVDTEVGEWLTALGVSYLSIAKEPQGPTINFPPWIITYGFKREDDAIAFALRFGT
jgi:hypothetical protein